MEDETVRHRWLHRAPKFFLFGVLALTICGFVVMGLWNWLMPSLFGLMRIGFWQALGLLVLSKILFGGFRHGSWHHRHHWRERLLARWEQMTPEEREKLRAGMRCCPD
jgi:Ca2+/H+ antiporter, TMEM165/GDT1 family